MARLDYWHKAYTCPYYRTNDVRSLGCEESYLIFPDKIAAVEYMDCYCANDWESCSIAKTLNRYEERKFKNNEFKKNKSKRRNDSRRNERKN